MKNLAFLQMQQEKLVNESQSFQELGPNETLRLMDGDRVDQIQGVQFVQWKQGLINLIREKSEKDLKKILLAKKKTMCSHCRRGLKKFEVKCSKDYKTFIVCEYITRALNA